jgi:hypothetical protein
MTAPAKIYVDVSNPEIGEFVAWQPHEHHTEIYIHESHTHTPEYLSTLPAEALEKALRMKVRIGRVKCQCVQFCDCNK